jgi:beta-fructofuranosidase
VLRDPEFWIWDSWTADDGERYHLFFLKAPSALVDQDLRHTAARIGHATSTDLTHWDVHEDALHPSEHGFDDLALWTGSVARGDDGVWRLYYTGINRRNGVRDQRIGYAESDDLFSWRRGGELVAPDPALYASSETWRDPFVFRVDGTWHMLITARVPGAPRLRDGVIGHATSQDMRAWELQPPLTEPARFGQLEVSQLRQVGDRWVLVFTCHPDEQADPQPFCTWIVEADEPLGPFDIARARPYEPEPRLFAAPLVQARDGEWVFLGFRDPVLHVIDPVPF